MEESGITIPSPSSGTSGFDTGTGLLAGDFEPGILWWTMDFDLPKRADLIKEYKKQHPAQLSNLRRSLAAQLSSDYKDITIACFKTFDPTVYVYGRRRTLGPIALEGLG